MITTNYDDLLVEWHRWDDNGEPTGETKRPHILKNPNGSDLYCGRKVPSNCESTRGYGMPCKQCLRAWEKAN